MPRKKASHQQDTLPEKLRPAQRPEIDAIVDDLANECSLNRRSRDKLRLFVENAWPSFDIMVWLKKPVPTKAIQRRAKSLQRHAQALLDFLHPPEGLTPLDSKVLRLMVEAEMDDNSWTAVIDSFQRTLGTGGTIRALVDHLGAVSRTGGKAGNPGHSSLDQPEYKAQEVFRLYAESLRRDQSRGGPSQ